MTRSGYGRKQPIIGARKVTYGQVMRAPEIENIQITQTANRRGMQTTVGAIPRRKR